MDLIGLLSKIISAVAFINRGRKGLDTDGSEHEGRVSYEIGIYDALSAFEDAHNAGDPWTLILMELTYLQQELNFCDESDALARNSLTNAIQSFEDALRCLKTVEDPSSYRVAETTYPTAPRYRIQGFPRDAIHIACAANATRLGNALKVHGINLKEKAVLQRRIGNMQTIKTRYIELQKKALL